jgi:hypothetical protein
MINNSNMPKTILLRSGWNRYNFGDVAHTPGFLRLAQQHLPDTHVIVWAASYPEWLSGYLGTRFPNVEVVSGSLGGDGRPADPVIEQAFDRADLFVFNSGPLINYGHELVDGPPRREGWRSFDWRFLMMVLAPMFYAHRRGLPFGIFGQSVIHVAPPAPCIVTDILAEAAFVGTRETDSLGYLRQLGLDHPHLTFVPDAAWSCDLTDDQRVVPWLRRMGLDDGRFLAVTTRNCPAGVSDERDRREQQRLWTTMLHTWLRETSMPIVLVPETVRSIELNKEYVLAAVPDNVRGRVIADDTLWADPEEFWTPDEAASLLSRAFAYVNLDHHGALLALPHGTPTLHPYQPQAGRKRHVFCDLGLGDWAGDAYADAPEKLTKALEVVLEDRPAASGRAKAAGQQARSLQAQAMALIRQAIAGS